MEVHREEEFILEKFKQGYSMARYGDGEFKIMRGSSITNMQVYDVGLEQGLLKVFEKPLEKLLIGIPDPLCTRSYVEGFHKKFDKFILDKAAKEESIFVSAFFSRPSLVNLDSEEYFDKIKNIWKDREVVLVNSKPDLPNHFLFRDSICEFVEISPRNCFLNYEQILYACYQFFGENKIFILSAGPVATCLAYDICLEGEQALDMGAIAFEYSLFKKEPHPEKWSYQDAYKIKRGYLRGINDE